MAEKTARLNQLDSLRGLAAISVVLWHWLSLLLPQWAPGRQGAIFRAAASRHDPRLLEALGTPTLLSMSPLRLFVGGSEAVILFFVLSGFVLSLPLWSSNALQYKVFITKRIFRIYVPYLAALALALAGNEFLSTGGIPGLNGWFNTTWRTPVMKSTIVGHLFMIGVYDDSAFNTAFWSLVHEMRISIVFPFVIALMKLLGDKGRLIPVPLILLGGWLSTLMPVGRLFASVEVLGFFLCGAYLAQSRQRLVDSYRASSRTAKTLLWAISLTLYSCGWLWIFPAYAFGLSLNYKDLFICLGACGLILLSLGSPGFSAFLLRKPARSVGRLSYSLYLVHATILWGLIYLLYRRTNMMWIFLIYVLASALIGFAFSELIEQPANSLGRALARRFRGSGPLGSDLLSEPGRPGCEVDEHVAERHIEAIRARQ